MMKIAGASVVAGGAASGTAGAHTAPLPSALDDVASATEQYRDPQVALDDGFVVLGPYVPDMGWHFLNPSNVQDAVKNGLDADTPQLLTYDDAGGKLTLASVEYGLPVGTRGHDEDHPPTLFDGEVSDEGHWHQHEHAVHVFAVPPPPPEDLSFDDMLHSTRWAELVPGEGNDDPVLSLGDTVVTDFASGGPLDARVVVTTEPHPSLWTLHAWVHRKNPTGVFEETNPTLANRPRP